MKSPLLAAAVCATALGSLLSMTQALAAPPCPECFYPYRACIRSAVTAEQQLACELEYDDCRATYCEFTATANDALLPRERDLASPVEAARIVDTRQGAR
ncbi:hypothetical protein GLA29479_3166 [Lysobacter antibioticus]|uniref:Lipoprotein n=1 Tax=Lysobacter antibioticus TaxID=84531 RepID=A0A0S2DZJ0_LYSAN|nr:hypothetical protein [Lysobacter antibioticus]ALN64020.1 hypothetical protein GLA29479_3166 [Lysobacter antibioticus]ALN80008.1 hypothetical protein LA76x_1856 [Lysobacter antibioticus]